MLTFSSARFLARTPYAPVSLKSQLSIFGKQKEFESFQELQQDFPLHRAFDYNPQVTLKPNFYVPPHPLVILTVPYGLFLVFTAWLAPSLLSDLIPLGALARYLGLNFNGLMALLSLFAGTLHLLEPIWALYLAGKYGLNPKVSLLWAGNAFAFGIFGLWPLVFPEYFEDIEDQYCAFSPCLVTFSSKKYQSSY